MKRNKFNNSSTFTHFFSIPFISKYQRDTIYKLQDKILQSTYQKQHQRALIPSKQTLMHLTLLMLCLSSQQKKNKAIQMFKQKKQTFSKYLSQLQNIQFDKIGWFQNYPFKGRYDKILRLLTDAVVRACLQVGIVQQHQLKQSKVQFDHKSGLFYPKNYHMTLFRVDFKQYCDWQFLQKVQQQKINFQIDSLHISTRFKYGQDGFYQPLCKLDKNI